MLRTLIETAPTTIVSRAAGWVAGLPVPRVMRSTLWGAMANAMGIDLSEALGEPAEWTTFDQFFTRRLRNDSRPLEAMGQGAMLAPCDGVLADFGRADASLGLSAKGSTGSLATWLGEETLPWRQPHFAVVGVGGGECDRVHSPIAG
ncbi:MAG: phosphatidylserine decarboxylase, partial [Myxococcales bacterium]|nr:phosphatidylserine decarboxylase [Myxococcales bacterium]